jgi:hypothetical protein
MFFFLHVLHSWSGSLSLTSKNMLKPCSAFCNCEYSYFLMHITFSYLFHLLYPWCDSAFSGTYIRFVCLGWWIQLLSTGQACCCIYSVHIWEDSAVFDSVSCWFQIVEASGASNLEWTESLAIGTCVEGEIQEIKDYGVIVNVPKHKDIVGFVTHYQCMSIKECKTLIHTSPFPPSLKVV